MRILIVVGTRPEVIKMAPVIRAMQGWTSLYPIVLNTAQHGSMLEQALKDRKIEVDHVMPQRKTNGLAGLTAHLLSGIDDFLGHLKPDLVLVQGDTTTALCGALAAFYRGIPIGHVEAGLRTRDSHEPFPEEINRRTIGQLATLHFAPTETACDNLREERGGGHVWMTGNTVVDELQRIIQECEPAWRAARARIPRNRKMVLVTCHRREALDSRLHLLIQGVVDLAKGRPELSVVWPLHANPAINRAAQPLYGVSNVLVTGHMPYSAFVSLLQEASLVITDSGGVIEEATTLGRRLLIIREETERPEALSVGARLVRMIDMPLLAEIALKSMETLAEQDWSTAFGQGDAGVRIVQAIESWAVSRGRA